MEIVKILWILVFFLFSFCLIFIWSKLYVIVKRLKSINELLKLNRTIDDEFLGITDSQVKGQQGSLK